MGDLRKKLSCRLILREKESCKETPGEKIPAVKKKSIIVYNAKKEFRPLYAGKKSYISRGLGNKFLPKPNLPSPPPPPQKSNGRPLWRC